MFIPRPAPLAASLLLLTLACQGQRGFPGGAGSAGPIGPAGQRGPAGPQGDSGVELAPALLECVNLDLTLVLTAKQWGDGHIELLCSTVVPGYVMGDGGTGAIQATGAMFYYPPVAYPATRSCFVYNGGPWGFVLTLDAPPPQGGTLRGGVQVYPPNIPTPTALRCQ